MCRDVYIHQKYSSSYKLPHVILKLGAESFCDASKVQFSRYVKLADM